jgi:hypothetical protein
MGGYGFRHLGQSVRKRAACCGAKRGDGRNQPFLTRVRRSPNEGGACRGELKPHASPVVFRSHLHNQPPLDQPADDHRDRTLVGEGEGGKVIDGRPGGGGELLQRQQLGARQAGSLLRLPGRRAQGLHDAPERLNRHPNVIRYSSIPMGSHAGRSYHGAGAPPTVPFEDPGSPASSIVGRP